jgi:hypothetical protein
MKVVYIIGPFRAASAWDVEQNIRRAEEIALEVWRLGAAAICPHTNTRFFQGAAPDDVWLAGDIEILKRCDAAIAVSDCNGSRGSVGEFLVCQENNIPLLRSLDDLEQWLEAN